MKIKFKLYFLILILGASCDKEKVSQTIFLNKSWKFKLGDSLIWAKSDFQDKKWDSIKVGNKSAGKVFDNYNGFAWYRIKVFIPSSIKKDVFIKDSIKIYLGAIDDCDQVFLNGNLVGENTKVKYNPAAADNSFLGVSGLWNKERKYVLAVADKRILWDKENVIAVRIFDQYGEGGMYTHVPFIEMVNLSDYLFIDTKRFYKLTNNNYVDKIIVLKNKSMLYPITGTLSINGQNVETKKNIYQKDFEVNLRSGQSDEITIDLPVSTDPIKLTFEMTDRFSNMNAIYYDSIPFVLTK